MRYVDAAYGYFQLALYCEQRCIMRILTIWEIDINYLGRKNVRMLTADHSILRASAPRIGAAGFCTSRYFVSVS